MRKHASPDNRVWMTFGHGVYDVTDFLPQHPGAQNIMLAAGGDVEPFWKIYSVHKGNEQVLLIHIIKLPLFIIRQAHFRSTPCWRSIG